MGHRLSKIYTRTGDTGTTGLGDGSRVDKDNTRIEAIGSVDELNSHIGMLRATVPADHPLQPVLSDIQHDLFDLGGSLCLPDAQAAVGQQHVVDMERILDQYNEQLPPLKNFILPAGNEAAARCHVARAVCRRAERRLSSLARIESLAPVLLQYLNRLSDLLFVLCRILAREDGGSEVLWQQARKTPG